MTYKFEYEEGGLPPRYSGSTDLWGFSNNSSPSAFPNIYVYLFGPGTYRNLVDGNKSPSTTFAKNCVLNKITYPTGGYREFVYEGNTALQFNILEHLIDPAFVRPKEFSRTDFTIMPVFLGPSLKYNFEVATGEADAVFNYQLTGTCAECETSGYTVKVFSVTTPGDPTGGTEVFSAGNQPAGSCKLPSGYYRVAMYTNAINESFTSLDATWDECTLDTATINTPYGIYNRNNTNVGGIRIKEIKDFDPVTGKTMLTAYKYKLYSMDSTLTSGLLASPIKFVNIENPGSDKGKFYALYTNSCYPMSTYQNSFVVYPEVRTIVNGNGWTDQHFSYASSPEDILYPRAPAVDGSAYRGNLLAEMIYKEGGTLLQKKLMTYIGGYIGGVGGIRFKAYYTLNPPSPDPPATDNPDALIFDREYPLSLNHIPYKTDCRSYVLDVGSLLPSTITDSLFTSSGVIVNTSQNTYATYDRHLLLNQVRQKISNNETKITTFRYPFTSAGNFSFGLTLPEQTVKDSLLQQNYFLPIEIVDSLQTSNGTVLLGGTKVVKTNPSTNKFYLSSVREYTSAIDYMQTDIPLYDIAGNVNEKQKQNDVKEVYIWGYNYSHLIVKVIGSDYATVMSLINNTVIQNVATSDSDMRTELDKIRAGLVGTNAQVTTYTYSPQVGITSVTGPNGNVVYYEYDSMQRLKTIRDQDGKIIKQIEYHYAQ